MVLNRAASFIYNFFSPLLGQTSFKAAPCCYEVIESEGGKIVEEEVCCVCLSRLVEVVRRMPDDLPAVPVSGGREQVSGGGVAD
ncbi:unnamed protein product [Prunus armeniaca]|uniref:Uncharacterized protein n=1 Tax=Prunus armeniaca TaxID=36596 RepID=A0A6J5VPN2_PRUAR|nr:unnamed protein product [Prunus armeniaca]